MTKERHLPKNQGGVCVSGRAYHLCQPWQILGGGIFMWTVFYSLLVKYFRSTWLSIILHGSINMMRSIMILTLIL